MLSCGLSFSLSLSSFNFFGDSCLYWCLILRLCRVFGCWEPKSVVLLLRFLRSEKFVWVGSQIGMTLWNHIKDCHIYWFDVRGLLRSDYGELCNRCVLFIRYGDSVVLLTLTAILLSIIVNIEWEISKLAVSVNFSNGVRVPVVFLFDGCSMKAVIVFVVVGCIIWASSMMTGCGFVIVSLQDVLTCIVKCGKCTRPCVVSMTTLLFLIKCNPFIGSLRGSVKRRYHFQFQI